MHASMLRVHRQVGLVPLAEDAESLEIALVRFHVARRILAAAPPKFRGDHFGRLAAEFLFDFRLDGQAVAIPAGNIGRTKSGHRLRLDDHVFHDLVQARCRDGFRRSDMVARRAGQRAARQRAIRGCG